MKMKPIYSIKLIGDSWCVDGVACGAFAAAFRYAKILAGWNAEIMPIANRLLPS